MTSSRELWYLTRGSGAVALVLLTFAVLAGILSALRVGSDRWPRFAVGRLHRNLTLLAIVFVALHVVTTVADGYAPIGLKDAIVPFASPYRPIWLGLGAVAFDLLLALVATSFLRRRIGVRLWRGVHWLAYASWPVAVVHALGTGSDARATWLMMLGVTCVLLVVAATLARVVLTPGPSGIRVASASATVAVALLVGAWYAGGPGRTGWAARAGTPARLIASRHAVRTAARPVVASPSPPRAFNASATGSIANTTGADGRVHVVISLRLAGRPGGALRIDLSGTPVGNGVSMDASGVSFVPATTRAVYLGTVTSLSGQTVWASVRDAAGDRLQLTALLALDPEVGSARGTVEAQPA